MDYETLETAFGWIVGDSDARDLRKVVFTNSGSGPEVPGELDGVWGPFPTEADAIDFWRQMRVDVND